MLKFIKHHMTSITDIDIYPVAAFVLFMGVFIVATWHILTTDRSRVQHMEQLPLSDNEQA
jgi:cytochrome c oxidase cbb3-type subunit 4